MTSLRIDPAPPSFIRDGNVATHPPCEKSTDEAIASLVERYDKVRLFDWQAASLQHANWLYAEGIHMTPEGCSGYANLVEPQIRAP